MLILDLLGIAALAIGLTLATVGLYGLLRMPELPRQLHAAGLVTGPATIAILLAAFATGRADVITSAVLVIVFLLITAPLSSHAIARASHARPSDEPEGGDGDRAPMA